MQNAGPHLPARRNDTPMGMELMSVKNEEPQDYAPTVPEQQGYWDERWSRTPLPNAWQRRRADAIWKLVSALPLREPKVLDLGCATGWFTDRLARLGEVGGIDLSEDAIAQARARYPAIRFEAGNVFDMELPAVQYDVVVAQEVVAHVPDQARFIEIIAHTLKQGGYLVITAANKRVMERVDFGPDPKEHIKHWLTAGDLKKLLRPRFAVLRSTSAIPLGDRGFLKVVNSARLNKLFARFVSQERLDRLKEWAGLGYSVIVLAQKRA